MIIKQLNEKFGIPGQIDFANGQGELPIVKVFNQQATALISLLGGQILSYRPASEFADMLFLSTKSNFEDGKAIRGGIPICWPWFGPDPEGQHRPNHGFVRNHFWSVAHSSTTDEVTTIRLQFPESSNTEKSWKQPFTLELEFNIGTTLSLTLTTHNLDDKPFNITQAFHTYFSISDIRHVEVLGLDGSRYFDKLDNGKEKTQSSTVTIGEEVDRIYEVTDQQLTVRDLGANRRIEIVPQHCRTGVVWNPWTKPMPDLEKDDYRRFLCVETGNVAFDIVHIQPGGKHSIGTIFNYNSII